MVEFPPMDIDAPGPLADSFAATLRAAMKLGETDAAINGVASIFGLDGSGNPVLSGPYLRGVKDRGAAGNGAHDDTAPFATWTANGGAGFIASGEYLAPGTVGAPPEPRIIIAEEATLDGNTLPLFSISRLATKSLPQHYLFVRQDNADRNDQWTSRVDRILSVDPAIVGGRGLQVQTDVNVDTSSTEWAISAVMNNHSDTPSTGNTATSGVANKYGLASVFGGHFQANDHNTYALPIDVTPIIGFESNIQAIGLDHPTSNNGLGNRRVADIIALTLAGGATPAEIGVGVSIRHNNGAANAHFRYGLAIDEGAGNTNSMLAGIFLRTAGARGIDMYGDHTIADIQLRGNSAYGILLGGTYSTAAIRMNSGQYIAMEPTAAIKTGYGIVASVWGFFSGASEVIGFHMGLPAVRISGNKIIGARGTALPADATDLATAITLLNALKARLSQASGSADHPLFA